MSDVDLFLNELYAYYEPELSVKGTKKAIKIIEEQQQEIQRLNNIINQARRMLGEHKHYSTPTEEQNTENEKIVDDVYFLLYNNLLGDESNENIK